MKKLGEIFKIDNVKQLVKLKNDKLTLKRHLKVTRHNNGVLKNIVEELQTKNKEMEGQLQEFKVQIANGTSKVTFLNKKIEQLTTQNEVSENKVKELKDKVQQLNTSQENYKNTDADLVISQQELKECNEEFDAEIKENLQCKSDKKTYQEKLEAEVKEHKNLQTKNSKTLKSLEESRMLSSANQKLAQQCQEQLEDEIEGKEILLKKYDSVCPSWSEWSQRGIKTRVNRCTNSDEQIKECNQRGRGFTISSCPSGK